MVLVTATSLLLNPIDVDARGGRGGGRGGGGRGAGGARGGRGAEGAYRGGHTMNRTPTMSRASSRTGASPARSRTGTSISQGGIQQSRQIAQQRPSAGNRTELRNQLNRYAQNRPAQNIDRQALEQRVKNFSSSRGNQIAQNKQLSDRLSQRLKESRPNSSHWFDQNFFHQHNIDMNFAGRGINWWRPAAWATIASWGSWNWSTPYYYDDVGYAYPITSPITTTESAYSSPYDAYPQNTTPSIQIYPAQSAHATAASTEEDWLPLGIFAVANNANAALSTNRFLLLAINRSGGMAGVLYNSTTDSAQDLTGIVDPASQKAYLYMANRPDSPIASTGIYNLTEDQTPINVHFYNGSEQNWILVRLKQ